MCRFFILSAIGSMLATCTLDWPTVACKDGLTVVIIMLDAWYQLKWHSYIYYMIYIDISPSLRLHLVLAALSGNSKAASFICLRYFQLRLVSILLTIMLYRAPLGLRWVFAD